MLVCKKKDSDIGLSQVWLKSKEADHSKLQEKETRNGRGERQGC